MKLDTEKWKEFRIGDLFKLQRGHTLTVEQKEEFAGVIPCVNGTIENNGVQCCLSKDIESIGFNLVKSPAISIVRVGNGGKTFVQTEDFYVADNAFALLPLQNVSIKSMIFISSLLDREQIKYSYGRTVTNEYENTVIKLPVDLDCAPDWQFMEDYIKSLHYEPLTTKNRKGQVPDLNVNKWKEFRMGDLFDVAGSTTTPLEDLEEIGRGKYPYVTTSMSENGVEGFYNRRTESGNVICIESACAAFATYQPEDFTASDHIEKCIPKFLLNPYIAMFMVTILNLDQYKYSYGRKCNQNRIRDRVIKLPVDSFGNPDWRFMENYIRALPYGDRL